MSMRLLGRSGEHDSGEVVGRREDGALAPRVVDFGLARTLSEEGLTVTGEVVGTPAFMAPEQAAGDLARVDRRADVYSLGATLYFALAGAPPVAGSSPVETILRAMDSDIVPLRRRLQALPRDLDTIVMKCLEREPARRYDTARQLAEDLGRFLDGEPIQARPGSLSYRVLRKARKHRGVVAVSLVAVTACAVLAGMWLHARWTAGRQAELAQRFWPGGIQPETPIAHVEQMLMRVRG